MTRDERDAGFPQAQLQRALFGVYIVFATAGLAFSTWAGRIPATRDALELTPGQLGLVLLVGAAGSLLGLPVAGKVAERIGAARTVGFGCCLVMAGLAVVGASITLFGSVVATALLLGVLCFGIGLWDVSMNLHGARVERLLGRTIMPRFHAAFSVGSVLGAGVAAAIARLGVSPLWHFLGAAVVLLVITLGAVRWFLPSAQLSLSDQVNPVGSSRGQAAATGSARSAWTEPRVLLIGFVVLVAAFTEGTANDWLAVAIVDGHHLPEWAGIVGLAVFLTFMTVGRVIGTVVLDRFGRVPVLRVTLFLAAVGSLAMVFGNAVVAFAGAAVWGFGASLGFPVGMSAAADDPRRAASRVSVVATIGYLAFIAGPPALGFLGDHVGVLRALSVVPVMVVMALFALSALAEPSGEPADETATQGR